MITWQKLVKFFTPKKWDYYETTVKGNRQYQLLSTGYYGWVQKWNIKTYRRCEGVIEFVSERPCPYPVVSIWSENNFGPMVKYTHN